MTILYKYDSPSELDFIITDCLIVLEIVAQSSEKQLKSLRHWKHELSAHKTRPYLSLKLHMASMPNFICCFALTARLHQKGKQIDVISKIGKSAHDILTSVCNTVTSFQILFRVLYEEEKQDTINREMDGSIKEDTKQISAISTQFIKLQTFKLSQKNINPVKDGLSGNTLKLMKACLKTIRDKHIESTGNLGQDNPNYYFLPTICVLETLRKAMLIHEQINSILFGVSYSKSFKFFSSSTYEQIVDCLAEYERKDMISSTKDNPDIDELGDSQRNKLFSPRNRVHPQKLDKRDAWDDRLRKFLIMSNEKWILEQFNLCKKFLNQNSIKGSYEDFTHPIYQYCHKDSQHMKIMRDRYQKNEKYGKHNKGSLEIEIGEFKREKGHRKAVSTTLLTGFEKFDMSLMKCDICALLRAIEEIENRIKMSSYIINNQKDKIDEKEKDKLIRQHFSMLNFNRNYKAIDYALKKINA